MKAPLKRLRLREFMGADRPPVIAVIGLTRNDVETCVAHAATSGSGLPVWAFCAEPVDQIEGCARLRSEVTPADVRRDLSTVWPALTVLAWTGGRSAPGLKFAPLLRPPFRAVICNEAHGFFAANPGLVAAHGLRRLRDTAVAAARRVNDWRIGLTDKAWSVLLALLGVLAKCSRPFARAAMAHHGQGYAGALLIPEPCGSRYAEIVIPGRSWPRCRVLHAAVSSTAHFIVFRRPGEESSPEPLIGLARDTGAFAVGVQTAYSGWRNVLVTRHPFRKLQPGEVTQVMAPWSPLLVIRRDLLLRFGVPRAATFGGALLILYWKAAAAGLRSLIWASPSDRTAPITQEPGMELEDAEFALRLILSRELRRLAASNPLRVRGNVVSTPALRKEFRRGLPRVLVLSPYLPFPLSHGGAVRMYNLCRAMSGEVDFVLACFREANESICYAELHDVFREVYVVDANEKYTDAFVPRQVVEYRNSAMAELIRSKCLGGEIDVVQLEYTQMAEYGDHTGAVPIVLVEHDLTFTLHEQLARTLGTASARREYELWRGFERSALQCSNAVWTMSERDKAIAIEFGSPRRSTVVVPNGVDLRRFQPQPRETAGHSLLFVGSFRHLPNLLAFEALRETIMPEVWKIIPDVTLNVIAGPHHERAVKDANRKALLSPDPRIRIQGFVEDVRPAYRECDIAVIPLPISAGTNIKLMEAMACGRAVVTTEVGCQGLGLRDEAHLLIREVNDGFADAIVRMLTDEALRADIAASARKVAESRFGWDFIASGALESYAAITCESKESVLGD